MLPLFVRKHTHTYLHTHAFIYMPIYTHMHLHTHLHTRAFIYTPIYTHMHLYTSSFTHARAFTHTCIYVHAHLHTHAFTHTHCTVNRERAAPLRALPESALCSAAWWCSQPQSLLLDLKNWNQCEEVHGKVTWESERSNRGHSTPGCCFPRVLPAIPLPQFHLLWLPVSRI